MSWVCLRHPASLNTQPVFWICAGVNLAGRRKEGETYPEVIPLMPGDALPILYGEGSIG
jgi:hypothetical protein